MGHWKPNPPYNWLCKGNLRSYIADAAADKLPAPTPEDLEHQSLLEQTPDKVAEQMEKLNPRAALQDIMAIIEKVSVESPYHND